MKGAVAGAAATVAMEQLNGWLYKEESRKARERYEQVTQGRYVPDRTAEKLDQLLYLNLSEKQRRAVGMTSHYLVGVGAGMAYALARRRMPRAAWGRGVAFGLAFFAVFDEMLTWVTGLAEAPPRYPWQAHARSLVGHVAYGLTADAALAAFRPGVVTHAIDEQPTLHDPHALRRPLSRDPALCATARRTAGTSARVPRLSR